MKRNKEKPIGTLLQEFLRVQGLETPLNEFRLVDSWASLMGHVVARNTGNIYIKNEILCVELKSPSLRADLMLRRTELVEKLNAHVGAHVIRDINFY